MKKGGALRQISEASLNAMVYKFLFVKRAEVSVVKRTCQKCDIGITYQDEKWRVFAT